MFSDSNLLTFLYNIKRHIDLKNRDCVLVVVGKNGVGKSYFALNLLLTWYSKILKQPISLDLIDNINVYTHKWLKRYTVLKPADMNIFDEAAVQMGSKDSTTNQAKGLEKVFKVIRYKRVVHVLLVPEFNRLNKYWREDRINGLFWIDKERHFKFCTGSQVEWLLNQQKQTSVFNMNKAMYLFSGSVPEFKDLEFVRAYESMKVEGGDGILDGVVDALESPFKPKPLSPTQQKVYDLRKKGFKISIVADKLGISENAVDNHIVRIKGKGYQV